ncbi:hypothetical protein T265_14583, partial [Opisthorchis viverrini]
KIDVCAIHRGYLCPNGECVPSGRDFYCNCDPGFTPSFDRRRCLNHCERMGPNICPNGRCVVMPYGDYECQCHPGYERSMDRKHCVPEEAQPVIYELPPIMPYINDEAVSPSKFPYVPTTRYTGGDQPYQWNSWRSHRAPNYQPLPRRSWSRPNGVSNAPCNQPHIVQRCSGGMCLNLGGRSYMCECLPGSMLSSENQKDSAQQRQRPIARKYRKIPTAVTIIFSNLSQQWSRAEKYDYFLSVIQSDMWTK